MLAQKFWEMCVNPTHMMCVLKMTEMCEQDSFNQRTILLYCC